jgi:hypothetical protein
MNVEARFDLETAEDVLAPQIKKSRLAKRRGKSASASRSHWLQCS